MLIDRKMSGTALIAFLLAIVHNYLFFGEPLGVSYPLFVLLFYMYYFSRMREKLDRLWDFSWFLFVVIIALSMTYVLFTNLIFHVLNFLAIPILIAIHTTIFSQSRNIRWFDIRIFLHVLDHAIPQTFRHVGKPFRLLTESAGSRLNTRHKAVAGKVIIGLIILLPLLVIVTMLLSSADETFSRLLAGVPEWVQGISAGEGFLRLLWVFALFPLLFGFVWGFVEPKRYAWEHEWREEGEERFKIRWDPIIIMTVLIGMNLVYLLFAAIQFSYLFGAYEGALPAGTTYAEHARSGFFELVAVSVINFIVLIATLNLMKSENGALLKGNRILLTLLVGCTGVMLISAYIRLNLYEQVYGYTYIRFLVHAFMIFLGALLVVSGVRIWRSSLSLLRWFMIIGLTSYLILNYIGMDRIIARQNIDRFTESGILDIDYLQQLSLEAMPLLIELSREDGNESLRTDLRLKYEELKAAERSWVSFNWSRFHAMQELEENFRN